MDGLEDIEPMYSKDDKTRDREFKEALKSCDLRRWISMLKGILAERNRRLDQGKKLNIGDERNMQKVGKLIISEYAAVMDMKLEEARAMIEGTIN